MYKKIQAPLKQILTQSQFDRYVDLLERKDNFNVDWKDVQPISGITNYSAILDIPSAEIDGIIKKVAIVKLNGGLNARMDLATPLPSQIVKNNENFFQIIFKQVKYLNQQYKANIPLVFMNSTATESETLKNTSAAEGLEIINFSQTNYPRLSKDTLKPLAKKPNDAEYCFYPSGHGAVYECLKESGILDSLLGRGIEYIFISNSDNLGATLDVNLLYHFVSQKKNIQVEVTPKKYVDVIGGTFITYPSSKHKNAINPAPGTDLYALLEAREVPPDYLEDFKSNLHFRVFNTNNIYIHLPFLNGLLSKGPLQLDVLQNFVTVNNQNILQLETAAGGIVSLAPREQVEFISVPRTRFLPVKSCSDLFLIQSNYFKIENGFFVVSKERASPVSLLANHPASSPPSSTSPGPTSSSSSSSSIKPTLFPFLPNISLGPFFVKLADYYARIPSLPDIADLDSLTIAGDVSFQKGVVLRGQVVIVAKEGERLHIPAGSVFENCVVQGALELVPRS